MATLNNEPIDVQDPRKITIPREGHLQINFVDLRPIPKGVQPLDAEPFAVLLAQLINQPLLEPASIAACVDDSSIKTKVHVVNRFKSWAASHPITAKVGALRRTSADPAHVHVRDRPHFVEAVRFFAIHHYLTCAQLLELLAVLPTSWNTERVELCSAFWARVLDRKNRWSDVMRALSNEQQVQLSQRLGYANVLDPVRPAMHYHLRMYKADEYQVAYRLVRLSSTAQHECFKDLEIDGVAKKIAQNNGNLWTIMRGNAAENAVAQTTLDFDFIWPDDVKPHWAAVAIQSAWRAYLQRQKFLNSLSTMAPRGTSEPAEHAVAVMPAAGKSRKTLRINLQSSESDAISRPTGAPMDQPWVSNMASAVTPGKSGQTARSWTDSRDLTARSGADGRDAEQGGRLEMPLRGRLAAGPSKLALAT